MAIQKYTMYNPCQECKHNDTQSRGRCLLYGWDKQKEQCARYRIFSGLYELAGTNPDDKQQVYEKVVEQAVDLLKFFGYKGELRYTEVVNI